MNLANQITTARLIIAIILFILLSLADPRNTFTSGYQIIMDVSLVLFIIAALSDILDGYVARKYNLITSFGRIADPLVDKIINVGMFIFFIHLTSFVAPWMVVAIIGREMLVSSLRSYLENYGVAFGSNWGGKFKMVFQCITVSAILVYLGHFQQIEIMSWFVWTLVWLTVIITLSSAFSYIIKAYQILSKKEIT